jgi:hypothetical protein
MITLIVIALAVAQLVRFLVFDNGPAQVFRRVRMRAGAYESPVQPGSLAELFNCHRCMAVPVSILVSSFCIWNEQAAFIVCFPFAVSFLAGAAVEMTRR